MPRRRRFTRRRHRRRTRRPRGRRMRRRRLVLDPERKFHDVSLTLIPSTGGVFTLLNGVPQGATENDHIGSACLWTSVFLKFSVILSPNVPGGQSQQLRWMIFQDKQPNMINPTTADLLSNPGIPVTSPRQLDFNRRFKILVDRVVVVTPADSTKFRKYFRNIRVQTRYFGTGSTIGDISQNSLFLVAWSDEPVAVDSPIWDLQIRSRFVG